MLFTAESVQQRFTAIAGEIRCRRPDLVLLQEVVRPDHAALLDRTLAEYERVPGIPTKRFFFWRILIGYHCIQHCGPSPCRAADRCRGGAVGMVTISTVVLLAVATAFALMALDAARRAK